MHHVHKVESVDGHVNSNTPLFYTRVSVKSSTLSSKGNSRAEKEPFPYKPLMRLPSLPTILRAFYTVSHPITARILPASSPNGLLSLNRSTVLKSMPSVPFIGSLFSSSTSSKKMDSFPVQKSDDEWQAILSKGVKSFLRIYPHKSLA